MSDPGGSWPGVLSETQMPIYLNVIQGAAEQKIRFALGGSLCMAMYAGAIRPSKDLDLYVRPQDRERMIELMGYLGAEDYYDRVSYDRSWIYRSTIGEEIIDIIWSMANHRTEVDDEWLSLGPCVDFAGRPVKLIPIEEMIWSKLYVLQRDRCDWPDVLNLIDASHDRIDWERLYRRLGADAPLLDSILDVYQWLRPDRPQVLRSAHWQPPSQDAEVDSRCRAALLDSRPWLISASNGANNGC